MPRLLELINFKKIVIVLAASFGIALGTCGLTLIAANHGAGGSMLPLGLIEIAVMALSLVGLLLTLVVWGIAAAIGGRGGQTTRLFDDSDPPNS